MCGTTPQPIGKVADASKSVRLRTKRGKLATAIKSNVHSVKLPG